MSDCIFCKIANGEMPSYTVYDDNRYMVIMDIAPSSIGHLLIIPKKHMDDIFSLDEETASGIFVLAAKLAPVLKRVLNCQGLNVLQNNGESAEQTVKHLHVHLIPRYENDYIRIRWKTASPDKSEFEKIAREMKELLIK